MKPLQQILSEVDQQKVPVLGTGQNLSKEHPPRWPNDQLQSQSFDSRVV